MTPEQVELVQASWTRVAPIADTTARLFYRRLFEVAPSVRPRFKTSISEQGDILLETLDAAVAGLERLDETQSSGRPDDDLRPLPEHYDTVAQTLLWTLGECLGEDLTRDARDAWANAYATDLGLRLSAAALGEQPTLLAAVAG